MRNILILNLWFRRCHLKIFLSRAPAAIVFGGAEPLFLTWPRGLGGDVVLRYFLSIALVSILFVKHNHLVLLFSGGIHWGNFGRGHYEELFEKLFLIWTNGSEGDVV